MGENIDLAFREKDEKRAKGKGEKRGIKGEKGNKGGKGEKGKKGEKEFQKRYHVDGEQGK